MLRPAKLDFADRHPDPFESLTPDQRRLHDRKVEEFNALRSACGGLISEEPSATAAAVGSSRLVSKKVVQGGLPTVDQLLDRIEVEVFAVEPDPFHKRLTSLLAEHMRRDDMEVRWVLQILERSQSTSAPNRYFCKCVWNRYGDRRGSSSASKRTTKST